MLTLEETLASQNNLTQLCAVGPFQINEIFSGNTFYGNDYILKKYVGFSSRYFLKAVIPHGIDLSNFVWEEEIQSPLSAIFSYSNHREQTYIKSIQQKAINKLVIPSASPFLYLLELLKKQPKPRKKGTIFFPAHSTHHITAEGDWESLAEQLTHLDEEYQPITVCIYWRDLELRRHIPFQKRGMRIVSAGHMLDKDFLFRFYHLCSTHRYSASNEIGSHIFFSIKSGCSYFHLDTMICVYTAESDEILKRDYASIPPDRELALKAMFSNPKPYMTKEQIDFVDYYLGSNYLKSPVELRAELLHTEELFNKIEQPELFFRPGISKIKISEKEIEINNSKHILLYTDDPGKGGVAQYNHSLLCGLAKSGYELTCVQSQNSNPLVNQRQELGIQHLWLDFDTTKDFNRTFTDPSDAERILSSIQPDLIIFSDCWPLSNFAAKQVAIEQGIPYIVVVGFVAPYPGGLPSELLDELKRCYIQAQSVIAVSSDNLKLLHQLFRLPEDKGKLIYYGRSEEYFNLPQPSTRDRLRQEFDIPASAIVCFTAARLDGVKGYQYQIRAIEQLKQSEIWDKLYFVWAGAGDLEAQIREAINDLGVSNQVKIIGQRWDVLDWLDSSDIFILPSESEGMPLTIMEAMAKGLPVVASAVSGIPEELGDTGKLIPDPRIDPEATVTELVATIKTWSANPDLRYSIGEAAKKRAEEMFREERMLNETVDVIQSALLPLKDYVSPGLSANNLIDHKQALVFFPHNPYPAKTGAHQRCLALLNGLKELGYDVTLFGSNLITDNPWQSDTIKDLQDDLGIKVEVYQGTQADRQFMAEVGANSKGLLNCDFYTPPGLHERFRQLFRQIAPDVVVINYAFWAELAIGDEFKSAVRIIDTIDLLTLNGQMRQALGQYLTTPPYSPLKIDPQIVEEDFFSKLHLNATPDEYWIYDQYDYTIAIAPIEAELIQEHTRQTKVEYVPMTFNIEQLDNTYTGHPLLAIGPNPFNIQGYLYFTKKVLPLVQLQLPEFCLQVVGSSCQHLAPVDGTKLLGFVSDLKPLYAESRFAVCPLIGGTGQKVKIVEAMAHGVPVIALRNVAEGSPIQHGVNGFIANNAKEFSEYTIQLFQNPELCRQMGEAARETIAANFSHEALVKQLNFLSPEKLQNFSKTVQKISPKIIVDGVFFQLYKTGIARVWESLLEAWANNGFSKHIILLDRARTAPKIPGIKYRTVAPYDYDDTDADREMLQQVCNEEGADLFISTYYTTPNTTPSVFMTYDMIPEVMGWDINNPMWQVKHQAIKHASSFITISDNTALDLVRFFPEILKESVNVALCGVTSNFSPATETEVNNFRTKYGIYKPYFMIVSMGGYKNTILFLEAFAQLASKQGFDIVCTDILGSFDEKFRAYTSGSTVHMLRLRDEELATAYSGAIALVYPSKYEGFGLPILEAMACGCPVITCPNASIPEVGGKAVLYVQDDDVDGMANALYEIQKPSIRKFLISAGLEQSQKFSWSKMAKVVSSVLIDTTLLNLNLKDINLIIFPDWSQPEELLCLDLERVIKALITHPESQNTTLLIDTSNISGEEVEMLLSGVTMNLLMEEDLDVTEGLELSLVGQLADIQWEALLPRIKARIVLEYENREAVVQVKAESLPLYEFDSLIAFNSEVISSQ